MKEDEEIINFPQNKCYLVLPMFSNYGLIDYYIFIPNNGNAQIINDTSVNDLELQLNKDLLICIQIKKDFQVIVDEYKEITQGWKKKKLKLKEKYPNSGIYLFLITQSERKEDGKKVTNFQQNENDIFLVFVDVINNVFFYTL